MASNNYVGYIERQLFQFPGGNVTIEYDRRGQDTIKVDAFYGASFSLPFDPPPTIGVLGRTYRYVRTEGEGMERQHIYSVA